MLCLGLQEGQSSTCQLSMTRVGVCPEPSISLLELPAPPEVASWSRLVGVGWHVSLKYWLSTHSHLQCATTLSQPPMTLNSRNSPPQAQPTPHNLHVFVQLLAVATCPLASYTLVAVQRNHHTSTSHMRVFFCRCPGQIEQFHPGALAVDHNAPHAGPQPRGSVATPLRSDHQPADSRWPRSTCSSCVSAQDGPTQDALGIVQTIAVFVTEGCKG